MATPTQTDGLIQGTALTRFVRVSPQKARLVIDLIRGHRAEDALQTLRFTKKRVARDIEKTLRSAIANAERKADDAGNSLDVDQLYVTGCFVNEGPRWKRMRPAPQGRGFRYQKRTSHITVQVAEHLRAAESRAAEAAAEAAASKGVKGAIRKARKTIEKRAKEVQKQRNKKK
ncbi:MAG: 50S ribosomal protein L22 [Candidatus Acidiferrales bacterium]